MWERVSRTNSSEGTWGGEGSTRHQEEAGDGPGRAAKMAEEEGDAGSGEPGGQEVLLKDGVEEVVLEAELEDSLSRMNSSWFLVLLDDEIRRTGMAIVSARWGMLPMLCLHGEGQGCNASVIGSMLQDREWMLSIGWGGFPTIDLVRDTFAVVTLILAVGVASVVLYVTIKCQVIVFDVLSVCFLCVVCGIIIIQCCLCHHKV